MKFRPALIATAVGLAGTVAAGKVLLGKDTLSVVDRQRATISDASVYVAGNSWGGCFCSFLEGGGNHELQNVTSGPSQVAVLSTSHAAYFNPSLTWTIRDGDTREVTVEALIEAPMKIWVLSGGAAQVDKATKDAVLAHDTFLSQKTGIKLVATVTDVTALNVSTASCTDAARLMTRRRPDKPAEAIFDEKAINVYYVDACGEGCDSSGGLSCPDDPRVNFVYSIGAPNVLAHEVGHALLATTGHWNGWEIGDTNIMRDSSAPERKTISTGQAITMNYESGSVLSKIGRRANGMNCRLNCPRLEFDESWSGCEAPLMPPKQPLPPVEAWFDCIECSDGQLSRVVNENTDNVLSELRQPLEAVESSAPAPADAAVREELNTAARRQRRAIAALRVMALQDNGPARTAIANAHQAIGRFRIDVQRDIRSAFLVTQ